MAPADFVAGDSGRADEADPGLYDWYFDPPAESKPVIAELEEQTGAIVIGRGAFGTGEDAAGWNDSPYHVKHFVLTHRPPAAPASGPVEFVFVPDGVHRAVELAREAEGKKYVTIGGGADVARQFLAAGLVDELLLHVVPKLLGEGIALFDGRRCGGGTPSLTKIRVVDSPVVTHLRYRVTGPVGPGE